MLEEVYKTIVKQLKINLEKQDFYKNICTYVMIGDWSIEIFHPWYVKDVLSGEDVFPETAQTDIDKEFVPMIALYITFSMKGNRQELERFKSLKNFSDFTEIKDWGTRIYAMAFDTDVNSAASECINIIDNVFDVDDLKFITVISKDGDEQICHKIVSIPEKNIEPIKVDGVATRVVYSGENSETEENELKSVKGNVEENLDKAIDIKVKFLFIGGIFLLFFILILYISMNKPTKQYEYYVDDKDSLVVDTLVKANVSTETLKEDNSVKIDESSSKTEVIGKWREANSGNFDYIWLLEKNKSTGKYQLTVNYPGNVKMVYNCIRKKIKSSNDYLFHDPDLGKSKGTNGFLTLRAGEIIYIVPGFDNGSNAILLIMPGDVNRVYTNDIDNRYYEFFVELKSVN